MPLDPVYGRPSGRRQIVTCQRNLKRDEASDGRPAWLDAPGCGRRRLRLVERIGTGLELLLLASRLLADRPAGAGGEPPLNLLRGLSGRVHARAIACELTMDHAPIATPPAARSRPIWQRPVSRRTVLATGAAGATAAALAALWKGNDLSQILNRVRDYTHGYQGALSTPRVRAAHLLRRAGFGATSAELDRSAAMTSTMMTDSVLNYQQT